MTAETQELQFPLPCPSCGANLGMPHRVTTEGADAATVTIRCGVCTHEWPMRDVAPPTFSPRPDRRQKPR